ncbi:hypothetical protein FLA_0077 [Filimonas lacunae]|nr:hypothetical protein FLA_0077 [Filimonas lacunae]
MNEMNFNAPDPALRFFTKVENIEYQKGCRSTKVTIHSGTPENAKPEYVMYDFQYSNLLTENFTNSNVLKKSWLVFLTVINVLPTTLVRVFVPGEMRNYNLRLRIQSLYAFCIFLLISVFGLSLIPACVSMLTEAAKLQKGNSFAHLLDIPTWLTRVSAVIISASTFVFTLAPNYRTLMTALATEFVCANYYLRIGEKRQKITGALDCLIEYIAETDADSEIHLHTYSFGTIVGMDILFPYGSTVSRRIQQKVKLLVTIGCPFEFLSNYYTQYFKDRDETMTQVLQKWYNIYSNSDSMSSNFRHGNTKGPAEYTFLNNKNLLPANIYYELANVSRFSWVDYVTLYSLKAHQLYWDTDASGASCLLSLYNKMAIDEFIPAYLEEEQPAPVI